MELRLELFRFVFLAAGLSCFCLSAAAQNQGPTILTSAITPQDPYEIFLDEFDETLGRAAATEDFVGLAVALVRVGEAPVIKTYGVSEVNGGTPITPDTVFRIASLSKGFASSMVGRAVAERKLSLDDPATRFAPRLAFANGAEKSLTLRYLLSHRTSLPPNAYDNLLEDGVSPDAILPQYRKVKPICTIGTCYAYQNITYDIAGRALQTAYGAPYEDLVGTHLFAPLGMDNSSFGSAALSASGNWARPHKRDRRRAGLAPGPWRVTAVKEPYYKTPAAGGVNASISDMAIWLNAQMGGSPEVLPMAVLDTIHTPEVATRSETRRVRRVMEDLRSSQYALGWRVYDYAGTRVIAHSGSVDGYGAQIMFIPDEGVGIVILSNTRTRRLWSIAPMFLDLTLGLPRRDWFALEDPITNIGSQ